MKVLLQGSFNQDDLKAIADLMRRIDIGHGGKDEFLMLISSPNETLEEADRLLQEIFPVRENAPYEIRRFLNKDGVPWTVQSSDKTQ